MMQIFNIKFVFSHFFPILGYTLSFSLHRLPFWVDFSLLDLTLGWYSFQFWSAFFNVSTFHSGGLFIVIASIQVTQYWWHLLRDHGKCISCAASLLFMHCHKKIAGQTVHTYPPNRGVKHWQPPHFLGDHLNQSRNGVNFYSLQKNEEWTSFSWNQQVKTAKGILNIPLAITNLVC